MSTHKLSGYAIKGDGTEETADRIRRVFEADGYKLPICSVRPDKDYYYALHYGDRQFHAEFEHVWDQCKEKNELTEIPLTEAEALVFGQKAPVESDELKVGMKVVFTDEVQKSHRYCKSVKDIHELTHVDYDNMVAMLKGQFPTHISHLRRATITDFLRTLPEDIAERALKNERSWWKQSHPESLTHAINLVEWECPEEGTDYWNEVSEANYDRARAILSEERVGKWWKNGGYCRCTRTDEKGNLYGYGVNDRGEWYDDDGEVAMDHRSLTGATPATPEEVKEHFDRMEANTERPEHELPKPLTTPPSEFPRVMWVFDTNPTLAHRKTIVRRNPDHPLRWEGESFRVEGHPEEKTDRYLYASDTHPVTGEPAVEKDVVEQIREVVDNAVQSNSWKVNEIKEILTQNKK